MLDLVFLAVSEPCISICFSQYARPDYGVSVYYVRRVVHGRMLSEFVWATPIQKDLYLFAMGSRAHSGYFLHHHQFMMDSDNELDEQIRLLRGQGRLAGRGRGRVRGDRSRTPRRCQPPAQEPTEVYEYIND